MERTNLRIQMCQNLISRLHGIRDETLNEEVKKHIKRAINLLHNEIHFSLMYDCSYPVKENNG